MRDFKTRPYSADEKRAADWIAKATNGAIYMPDDPIGVLIVTVQHSLSKLLRPDPTPERHTYPEGYEPDTGVLRAPFSDAAWTILDVLPVGALSDDQRAMMSGVIAGAIEYAVSEALAGKPIPKGGSERAATQ